MTGCDQYYAKRYAATYERMAVVLSDGTMVVEKPPRWFRLAGLNARRSQRVRITPRPRARRSPRTSRSSSSSSSDDPGGPASGEPALAGHRGRA